MKSIVLDRETVKSGVKFQYLGVLQLTEIIILPPISFVMLSIELFEMMHLRLILKNSESSAVSEIESRELSIT